MAKINKKILIIEDERVLLKALKTELEELKYKVFFSTDGKKGLFLVKKEMPDLILLDLILPKMDGFKVLEEIKNNPKIKNIPVIIISNLGEDENIEKGMEMGAADYFVKASSSLKEIVEKIDNILKEEYLQSI